MLFRIPLLLRPRLTWRYIVSAFAILYVTYCYVFGQPLFSSKLPDYTGKYDVGTIDLEIPFSKPREISDAVYKDTDLPAFKLETVLFSVYYPAQKGARSSHPKHTWISKPVSLKGEGYARVAHINNFLVNNIFTLGLWSLAGGLRIPAKVDVPLYSSDATPTTPEFPIIVFSHGAISSRTDYTQYCAEIASRGYIVAAIEHRDGSGPGTMVMREDGSKQAVYSKPLSSLDKEGGLDSAEHKKIQLAFRQAEVEETIRVLRLINEGRGDEVFDHNLRREGAYLKGWDQRLSFEHVTMAGHSYGATLALQTLKGAPSSSLPITSAIVLDPGKGSGPLNSDVNVPTLIVHSNSWSRRRSIFYGRPHFDVVKELVQGIISRGKGAWFLTSVGTSHPSVTDAPLIEPLLLSWTTGSTIDVKEGIREYVKVSLDFLDYVRTGSKAGILGEAVTHPEYNEDTRDKKRKAEMPQDITKYWQIHVSPVSPNDST